MNKVFIIVETGVNHNGNMDIPISSSRRLYEKANFKKQSDSYFTVDLHSQNIQYSPFIKHANNIFLEVPQI